MPVLSSVFLTVSMQMQQLLSSYKIEAKFVELDNIGVPVFLACDPLTRALVLLLVEGDDIQDTLASMTGSSTVPQLFIGGKYIGGFDGKA